jgi:diguanylate cyclase (GGDEF)-like protein
VGVAAYPQNGHTVQALLKAADEAMYRAKAAGKNDYRVSRFSAL